MTTQNNNLKTIGSLCSGIEAASVAWENLGYNFEWYSEIADFPNKVLKARFPETKNLGDMAEIPQQILNKNVNSPDLICGGTPCQAFSYTGFRVGLNDERGNLTLKFIDVINANDEIRLKDGKERTVVFWENVEGVLSDNTNAFGCLVSSLAGLENPFVKTKWPKAGILRGPVRNVAWRVIDAKYYGLPQQRKRLYLLAGGKTFSPERVLFEKIENPIDSIKESPQKNLSFKKDGHDFEVFREYTDCLYAAYGTKWNGNSAANNGSLFVVQDGKIRRFSPLECERLMGFPDNFTDVKGARRTQRYTAIGNSWAVPVIKWIGSRFDMGFEENIDFSPAQQDFLSILDEITTNFEIICLDLGLIHTIDGDYNCSTMPENPKFGALEDIVSAEGVDEKLYITPTACHGILRRGKDRVIPRLKQVLEATSSQLSLEEIEKNSRKQPRGRHSGMAKLSKKLKSVAFI